MRFLCICLVFFGALTGCARQEVFPRSSTEPCFYGRRLEPAAGKVLHGIGQDLPALAEHLSALGPGPVRPMLFNDYFGVPKDGKPWTFPKWERITKSQTATGGHIKGLNEHEMALQLGMYLDGKEGLLAIIRGEKDANFAIMCEALEKSKVPVFLRPGYEFNGEWNKLEPGLYCQAWIHLARMIREKCPKVALVWCYAVEGADQNYMAYYPGDEWVDWWAIDLFSPEHLTSAATHKFIEEAAARRYPVMIAECSARWVGAGDGIRSWNVWFAPFFALFEKHPNLKAFCYIDWNWMDKYPSSAFTKYWGDCRIWSSAENFAKWKEVLKSPRFIHGASREHLWEVLNVTP